MTDLRPANVRLPTVHLSAPPALAPAAPANVRLPSVLIPVSAATDPRPVHPERGQERRKEDLRLRPRKAGLQQFPGGAAVRRGWSSCFPESRR